MKWYAVYTKPKLEEMVAGRLRNAGLEIYHPKIRVRKYVRGRYRDIVEPLFPCYLFVRFAQEKHHWMIRYTRGVKRVVGGQEGPWPLSDEMIHFIRAREKDGVITVREKDIKEGDRVKIADGPFAGLTGIFEKPMKGKERVLLLLSAIEYQARVVVDRASLIKVD